MKIEHTDATLGALVTGIRISELQDAEWKSIESAFVKYAVLIFPGQQLKPEEQVAFGRRFGPGGPLVRATRARHPRRDS